jgi:hypothetical protein
MTGQVTGGADVDGFDLREPPQGFIEDPYPWYAALRTTSPVHKLPGGDVLLTRYCDLAKVYADVETFSSDKREEFAPRFGEGRLLRHHTTSLVFNDAPYHRRVRKLITGALTPRAIAAREAELQSLVERLLDRLEAQACPDLIAGFAAAIPVEVIGDLLGVPRDERSPLRDWSLAVLGALEPAPTPEALSKGETALALFHDFLGKLVERRRANPLDPDEDVLSRLMSGADGARLSEAELLENCVFLLNAGHETTTNLIGNLLELLWRFPEARRLAASDASLMRGAVEEALRFESSNQLGGRTTRREIVVGAVPLAAGERLTLCIGAANRDPAAFDAPDRFDVARTPNRHLAFGGGPHLCAGLSLARLEARVAASRLLARFPDYEILPGAERSRRVRFRGFTRLPARLN